MSKSEYYKKKRPAIRKSLGKVVKKYRKKSNISQTELAEVLGVSKGNISRYESGTTDMPASSLPIISDYCGFKMKDYSEHLEAEKTFEKLEKIVGEGYVEAEMPKELLRVREETVEYLASETGEKSSELIESVSTVMNRINELGVDYISVDGLRSFTIEYMSKEITEDNLRKRLLHYFEMMNKPKKSPDVK